MDKYNHIIEMGKALPVLDELDKNDDLLVQGCQSKVWLKAEKQGDYVRFWADADAIIAKGIVAMLIDVFDNQPAKEVAAADLGFLEEIGLKDHLSPTRANGLMSMIKQMKFYALAFGGAN
jgi:cysteine desulfuration protein SufE